MIVPAGIVPYAVPGPLREGPGVDVPTPEPGLE